MALFRLAGSAKEIGSTGGGILMERCPIRNLRDSFQHRIGTLGLSWNGGILTDHREFSYDR